MWMSGRGGVAVKHHDMQLPLNALQRVTSREPLAAAGVHSTSARTPIRTCAYIQGKGRAIRGGFGGPRSAEHSKFGGLRGAAS